MTVRRVNDVLRNLNRFTAKWSRAGASFARMAATRKAAKGPAKMLDLDLLSEQTLGNQALEREVLGLFLTHADRQVALIRAAPDITARREAAHALLGAARAIGAAEVSSLAGDIERREDRAEPEIEALARAVTATSRFISARLAA
jgi:HPt (histidine-containing phosphotransfer) domain-containing protein